MKILIGYGYFPTTTGRYIEEYLAKVHEVIFVGAGGEQRSGFPPDVDLVKLIEQMGIHPDLFLYIDSDHRPYLPRNIEKLNCPTAAYLIDVHLGPRLRLPLARPFDYVFIAQKDLLSEYQLYENQHVCWLPLAFDPGICPERTSLPLYDVGFVGNLGGLGEPRTQLIAALEKEFTMNDFRRFHLRDEMGRVYAQSKIVFNYAINGDLNMRVFEAMGCGSLLVTNRIENGQSELFQEDKHLVAYSTLEELLEKIRYYLAHEGERLQIARAGFEQVLRHHTYQERVNQILKTIFTEAPGAESPFRKAPNSFVLDTYADLYSKFRLLDASFEMTKTTDMTRRDRLATITQVVKTILRKIRYG